MARSKQTKSNTHTDLLMLQYVVSSTRSIIIHDIICSNILHV